VALSTGPAMAKGSPSAETTFDVDTNAVFWEDHGR
jgi:hypothetical protein